MTENAKVQPIAYDLQTPNGKQNVFLLKKSAQEKNKKEDSLKDVQEES